MTQVDESEYTMAKLQARALAEWEKTCQSRQRGFGLIMRTLDHILQLPPDQSEEAMTAFIQLLASCSPYYQDDSEGEGP